MSYTRFRKSELAARGFSVMDGPEETPVEIISEAGELKNIKKITGELNTRDRVVVFDDFLYKVMAATYTPWTLHDGTDGDAADPAINAQVGGVARFVGGGGDGSIAEDASQMVLHLPMTTEGVGRIILEARVKFVSAITNGRLFVGLTDSAAREIAFSIATATVTSVATDAAGFLYDDGATAKTWHALSVANDLDAAGNLNTTIAPKITWQTLRVEVDDGVVDYFIDGVKVHTIDARTPRKDIPLYATVCLSTTGTTRSLDVDYVYVAHER